MFFIRHTSQPATPPGADDPAPVGLDADMLTSFQQHLPTITAEVQASVERARNSPPPAPPDPDGRRFWRVKAEWDEAHNWIMVEVRNGRMPR